MTARVVSQPITKETTCFKCRAVLQYEYGDMIVQVERDYTGCGETVARIKCPVCAYKTAVPARF